MSTQEKSAKRKELESLGEAIYISWLRDCDRVDEMISIIKILIEIESKPSIEDYFEQQEDFIYFLNNFSTQIISNILRQPIIFGNNGENIAVDLLSHYYKLFIKHTDNAKYIPLWNTMKDIFDFSKSFYKGPTGQQRQAQLPFNKTITFDEYNNLNFRQKNEIDIQAGTEIDFNVSSPKERNSISNVWIRGKITEVHQDLFEAESALNNSTMIKYPSFNYAIKGTFTNDWEWRENLQVGDVIDCYERQRFYPATIMKRTEIMSNNCLLVEYLISFRVYLSSMDDDKNPKEKYYKHWSSQKISKDNQGNIYLGDIDNYNETIPMYSKRLFPRNTHIQSDYFGDLDDYLQFDKFIIDSLINPNDKQGNKVYAIGRKDSFTFNACSFINNFGLYNGIEKITSLLSSKESLIQLNNDILGNLYFILLKISNFIAKDIIIFIAIQIKDSTFDYLNTLSNSDLRNIKRETIEIMIEVMNFYLKILLGDNKKTEIIEEFLLSFSIKMIKTTYLDKRISAVKTIIDLIKNTRTNAIKEKKILEVIEKNQIFYEIYGPNSHVQLITKSKELLEIMLKNNRLSEEELKMIWLATKKGDLESKFTIVKILTQIALTVDDCSTRKLLEMILSSNSFDLIDDEIDLIYHLCLKETDQSLIEQSILYLIQFLFESCIEDNDRLKLMIDKIYIITIHHPLLAQMIINKAKESINENKSFPIASMILIQLKSKKQFERNIELNKNKSENEDLELTDLYIKSFRDYYYFVKNKMKNYKNEDIDDIPLNDKFTHSQNIKARLIFMNSLLDLSIWNKHLNPIDFIYKYLVEEALCANDEKEFYLWLRSTLDHRQYDIEAKVYKLFSEKIFPSIKDENQDQDHQKTSIANISFEAFIVFYQVFENVNINKKNIICNSIERNNNESTEKRIKVLIKPQELEGFDILWRIIFESNSPHILTEGIATLHNLFTKSISLSPSVFNQELINLCFDELKKATKSNIHLKIKCINFLQIIIEKSELNGTANIISHAGLIKGNLITIEITSYINNASVKEKVFKLQVYSNTTIYDLKKMISASLEYHFDFIRFAQVLKENNDVYEITHYDHGKTLQMMNFTSNTSLLLYPNHLEETIPCEEICINKRPTPEVLKIFHQWFDIFSTNGKMTPDDCARFVKGVTNSHLDITASDSRVKDLFNDRDKNKDGLIEREDFIEFYNEAIANKVHLVNENLKSMGVRNDLLLMSDAYYPENENKEILPRYLLAINQQFFNQVFEMINDEDSNLSKTAFDFVRILPTNPMIYNRIKNAKEEDDWTSILSEANIMKLIYSLQIIESFIENVKENQEWEEWIQVFLKKNGFGQIMKIFIEKLSQITKKECNEFTISSFEYLIKLVKIFYIAGIDTFNTNTDDDYMIKINMYLIKEHYNSIITSTINSSEMINNLMNVLETFINKPNDQNQLMNTIIELITILIPISITTTKSFNINTDTLIKCISYGLFSPDQITRVIYMNSTIRMCTILLENNHFSLIEILFNYSHKLLTSPHKEENNKIESNLSVEFFNFFTYLLEIFDGYQSNFKSTTFNLLTFIQGITSKLKTDINNQTNIANDHKFICYINILSKLSNKDNEIKDYISNQTNLLQEILSKVLFKQDISELDTMYSKVDFIEINTSNQLKTSEKNIENLKASCYQFILSLVKGSLSNFEKFFNVNVISKKEETLDNTKKETKVSNEPKREGYVGLKNLGCICYMNSTMQQFFMVPTLRYMLLRFNDNEPEVIESSNDVDDNMFHQLQRLFSFLELSERIDYNPFGFAYSFKDFDGLPTKLSEQKDAQEFLGIFLDRLEYQCKFTKYKHMVQSIFGGKNCSQIICDRCGKISNRFEDTVFLSVEVKNMKTLNESFDKLISEEKIDGYKCDECNQEVSITKRNAISSLPNVLIVHLQRICYNFEYDRNEKINTRLEFPRQINLKPYTIEEMTRKSNTNNTHEDNNTTTSTNLSSIPSKESNDIYFRSDAYYDYYLMGVIVHAGSADSGHYFSYINTIRGGNCCEAQYNPNDKSMSSSWLEFNDSIISKFNVDKLENECFGGVSNGQDKGNVFSSWSKGGEKCRNAYMLIYERKIKSPLKIIIEKDTIAEEDLINVISFKEESEAKLINKENDLLRYYNTPDFQQKQKEILSKVFFDVSKGEYYKYEPYYFEDKKIPKKYYVDIIKDNGNFEQMQNTSDEQFTQFFNKIIILLEETMQINLDNITNETALQISSTFLNFIYKILSKKDRVDLLLPAIKNFIHIVKAQPICQKNVWDYMYDHLELFKSLVFNENKLISKGHCILMTELLVQLIELNSEAFIESIKIAKEKREMIEITTQLKAINVFEGIISQFPKIPVKALGNTGIIFIMIKEVLLKSYELFEYYSQKEFLFIFITFLLGKESPCYDQTLSSSIDNWDFSSRCNYILGGEHIVQIFYDIYKSKNKLSLSERDLQCISSINFIKFIYKQAEEFLSDFLINLSQNNQSFTLASCIEIIKIINNIDLDNDSKQFYQIIQDIIPLLNVKDEYQLMRFELLLGIPKYEIESNLPYPLIGYHNMVNPSSKCFNNNSSYKQPFKDNIIQKLYEIKNRYECGAESFLLLLEACLTNDALWLYLKNYPYENLLLEGFIEWGVCIVNHYGRNDQNPYRVKMNEIVTQLNTEAKIDLLKSHNLLPGFIGFYNDYLIEDITKAEIQLLHNENNVAVFLCEYTAHCIMLNKDNRRAMDYSKSKRNATPIFINNRMKAHNDTVQGINNKDIDNTPINPFNTPDEYIIQTETINYLNEKDFYHSLLMKFKEVKKVIIESKTDNNNNNINTNKINNKNIIRRILALNSTNQSPKIKIQLKRMENIAQVNEYIPLSIINCSFLTNSLLEVYSMHKWNPELEWTWQVDPKAIEINVIMDNKSYTPLSSNYGNGNSYTNYYKFPNSDNQSKTSPPPTLFNAFPEEDNKNNIDSYENITNPNAEKEANNYPDVPHNLQK